MARRAASDATDDSLKENSRRAPVKDEKPTRSRKSMLRDNQRAQDEDDESQENHEEEPQGAEVDEEQDTSGGDNDEEEDEEEGGSPKGRKRARANTLGDSRPTDGHFKEKKKGVTLPRDVDGFIPGSIVRIQLKNFVTYDYVEFFPGPHLNMILGPNGTGKSSIACAICIGLNFPTSVLGRAAELSAFVKLGAPDGHIEIELKGPQGKPNLVIKRTLQANSKKNQFFLNGRTISGREINNRMAELNVQVSNLCSFLPQDKVAEFARMSPQQLLRETQRAAGDEKLTAWHDTLIEAGHDLKAIQEKLDKDREQLQTLQDKNANLEREVKRYEERRAIERKIEFLELLIPVVEYNEAKKRWAQLKEEQSRMQAQIRALKQRNAPYIELQEKMDKQAKRLETKRDAEKDIVRHQMGLMAKRWQQNNTLENRAEELKTQLDNLKSTERKRAKEIEKLKKEIEDLQKDVDNPPQIEDIDAINAELRELKNEGRGIAAKQRDLQDRQHAHIETEARYKGELEGAYRDMKQLEDLNSRRFNELAKADKDAAEVVQWLRKNRDRFQKDIIEPPYLSVTVEDKRFASVVQGCLSWNDLRTFVAQTQEDLATFNRLIVDTGEALGRRIRVNSWYRPRPDFAEPPMSPEDLKSLGFDGYASDFVQCPEGLRPFLNGTLNMHRTAVAVTAPDKVDSSRATDMVARAGGASFIIGTTLNVVSRSRYGQKKALNQTREIKLGKIFGTSDVDPSTKAAIEKRIAENRFHVEQCKKIIDDLTKEDSQINAEINRNKAKTIALGERKTQASNLKTQHDMKRASLEYKINHLAQREREPPIDVERTKLKTKILKCALDRAALLQDYEKLMKEIIARQTESTKFALQKFQVVAKHEKLKELCGGHMEELERALTRFSEIHEQYQAAKDLSKEKLDISRAKYSEADEELRQRISEEEQNNQDNVRDIEQLSLELETERQNLELTTHTNPGVIEMYNARVKNIEELKQTVAEREEKLAKKERSIKIARDAWEPALNRLVESVGQKFSTAFDRIGCAGEIKLTQHEDYGKWAIDILVKFRDSEKLQLLTGERQSGGERSLTTIMYLMSLTEEARTPFSLVDEINQGMDARAERAVHNSLVEVTCKADSGQYFLITPKLLTDLMYHERMKVLCVNNGEWLPEETDRVGNMMRMIEGYVNHRSRSSA